jgi:hypothetical protein
MLTGLLLRRKGKYKTLKTVLIISLLVITVGLLILTR